MYKVNDPSAFRSNVRQKLSEFDLDSKTAGNLEIGIFNFAIKESTKNKIIKKWENPLFVQIYRDRLYSIYTNIKDSDLVKKIFFFQITTQ